jgi:anti-sigma factor RsiW
MLCEDVSLLLAEAVEPKVELSLPASSHLESCLRCQAELVQYKKLSRALQGLRSSLLDPAPNFLNELLDELRPLAPIHKLHQGGRRRAYIGGIAAAATAGAAGAIVIASRLSKQRLAS